MTTGNYGAIDLWLETAARDAARSRPRRSSGEVAIAELGVEPRVFAGRRPGARHQVAAAAGGDDRAAHAADAQIKLRAEGDTRLYVRVQQEDGHRMWSSPIYLFR